MLAGAHFLNFHQNSDSISDLVTELQTGDNGELTAIIIWSNPGKETGILLKDNIPAVPTGSQQRDK